MNDGKFVVGKDLYYPGILEMVKNHQNDSSQFLRHLQIHSNLYGLGSLKNQQMAISILTYSSIQAQHQNLLFSTR